MKWNEKVWNILRVIQMWQRDVKWANTIEKNGDDRLAWHWVDRNLQLVILKSACIIIKGGCNSYRNFCI